MNITRARLLIAITIVWCAAVGFSITARAQDAPAKMTIWDNVYSDGQAKRGEAVYTTTCSPCHGEDMLGSGLTPPLKGTDFVFHWTGKSVGDLFTRLSLMPPDDPSSLPRTSYLDVLAFLLKTNGYPAGDKEVAGELESLKQIAITPKP